MQKNNIGPHFICLAEHHLKQIEITKFSRERDIHLPLRIVEKNLWEEEYVFL
jgi:hypothetical protein